MQRALLIFVGLAVHPRCALRSRAARGRRFARLQVPRRAGRRGDLGPKSGAAQSGRRQPCTSSVNWLTHLTRGSANLEPLWERPGFRLVRRCSPASTVRLPLGNGKANADMLRPRQHRRRSAGSVRLVLEELFGSPTGRPSSLLATLTASGRRGRPEGARADVHRRPPSSTGTLLASLRRVVGVRRVRRGHPLGGAKARWRAAACSRLRRPPVAVEAVARPRPRRSRDGCVPMAPRPSVAADPPKPRPSRPS